ncbi:gamma carbonic anhydrase family protein [Sciscionella sediminilitoris]|uniref:gamma carbonic anhydrase family protein n=1 Tax=Sciscionella sediminilitoris TaxID=1445613 RepID=UPI0004DF9C2F|nr:gamma carbonic anhydrase family protein [Sciscionella sp. SE31]
MLFSFEGKTPNVHEDAWIAPTATLIGDVTVEAGASVWYGAVLRADFGPIRVEERANVQDNTVIHCASAGTVIGRGATVGHSCVVHEAQVGAGALIGNGSTVLDGATVGEAALIAAGALVPPGAEIPAGMTAMGAPAKRIEPMSETAREWVEHNSRIYAELAARHRASTREV